MSHESVDLGAVEATPEHAFAGRELGAGGKTPCLSCGETIRDGDPVGAYLHRPSDGVVWTVARVFCDACNPKCVAVPTLGAAEVVVTGRAAVLSDAATQDARLVLRSPSVSWHSPPGDGGEP